VARLTGAGALCVSVFGRRVLSLGCGSTYVVSTAGGILSSRLRIVAGIIEILRFLAARGAGLPSQPSWSDAVPLLMRGHG